LLPIILTAVPMEESAKNKFETIYYKYRNLLFTYTKNIVLNDMDAEDVLQDAFIKIAQNINCIDDTESKETISFLIVVAKNCAYDFLRKKSRYKEIPLEEIDEISYTDEFLEQLVLENEYQKIILAIKCIPSPYSEVLYFHFAKDYSVKKTAAILGRKTSTVKMQIVRGKKILIKELLGGAL